MKTMFKKLCNPVIAAAALALAVIGAGLPTYRTFSGYGNATSLATVLLPSDPNAQIRLVSLFYGTDTNIGQFTFTTGGTAYAIGLTNPASFTTNVIGSGAANTNGLYVGQAILQHGGVDYTNNVTAWGTGTNVTGNGTTNLEAFLITGSGFAVAPSVGDSIWMMTNSANWNPGAAGTNQINGDDIYSGNYGAPVEAQFGPCQLTNRIYLLSAHYDSASQP